MAFTRNDQMRIDSPRNTVVTQSHINIGKAMAEGSAPHRPKPMVAKGSQQVPPEGMVKRSRPKLEGNIPFEHGIPFNKRKSLL